jgi:hypothetical protein
MKSKYIIIELDGMEVPLVFPRFLLHEAVAMSVNNTICSAGFCELSSGGKWIAGGQSISLNLNARPQDAEILNGQLGAGDFAGHSVRKPLPTDASNKNACT